MDPGSSPNPTLESVSTAAITAAAIAAVSISARVRRRTRLAEAALRAQRRRNTNPGSRRPTVAEVLRRESSSSNESCSESKPCLYCQETLTQDISTREVEQSEVGEQCPVCLGQTFHQCADEVIARQGFSIYHP